MPSVKHRVLVVDDSPIAADVLAEVFDRHGFDVRTAIGMDAAQQLCTTFHPLVLVTDVFMPNLDVAELCRVFRAASSGRPAAVVLVSGRTEDELRARLDAIKPDAFISKLDGASAVAARVGSLCESIVRQPLPWWLVHEDLRARAERRIELFRRVATERLARLQEHWRQAQDRRARAVSFLQESHTLKGEAGLMGFVQVLALVDAIEGVVKVERTGCCQVDSKGDDLVVRGLVLVRSLVACDPAARSPEANEFCEEVRAHARALSGCAA